MPTLRCPSYRSSSASSNSIIFTSHQLETFASSCYEALGLPLPDAKLLANSLVQADLWGHPSHGILRTFWYGARFQTKATKAITHIETVMDAGALALIDGNDGVGQVITQYAMKQAIEKAKIHGIGAISVRNSGQLVLKKES